MQPTIHLSLVIIGRPNVGKSTLFNRLIGKRKALVHDLPGVTRDRIQESVHWWVDGKSVDCHLTDTGGLGGEAFADEIRYQVETALEEADVVLWVLDSQAGVTALDEQITQEILKTGLLQKKPVIGVVNKVDSEKHEERIADFFELGFAAIVPVSAEHGRGINELKDEVLALFSQSSHLAKRHNAHTEESSSEEDEETYDDDGELEVEESLESPPDSTGSAESEASKDSQEVRLPRIAIVGKPNVGKSTLMNSLIRKKRAITSPIAGTTVDALDVEVEFRNKKKVILIDTAGIRRKGKTNEGVEVLSVVQTKKALESADVALLIVDGEKGIADQDEKIGGMIEKAGCSVILVVNKWDTQSRNQKFTKDIASTRIRKKMAFLKYAPVVFISALKKQGLDALPKLIQTILEQKKVKIPAQELTKWVKKECLVHNPRNAKFYLCHQLGKYPPSFVMQVNDPEKIDFSLKRHLVNGIRQKWGYMGSPIRLIFKASGRPENA